MADKEEYNSIHDGPTIDAAVLRASEGGFIDAAIQAKPNPNLLDNWYFGNPVNQRGFTEYTEKGYTIDRWKMEAWQSVNQRLSIGSNGILIANDTATGAPSACNIAQFIENPERFSGKTVTFSGLLGSVTDNGGDLLIWILVNGSSVTRTAITENKANTLIFGAVVLPDEINTLAVCVGQDANYAGSGAFSIEIKAVKLELGDTQTLAHQDENGNWVLNEIPNYGEQLARCQRYFYNPLLGCSNYTYFASGQATSTTKGFITVPTPTTMRAAPAVDFSELHLTSVSGGNLPITSISSSKKTAGAIQLACDVASGLVAGDACLAVLVDYTAGHLWFDANI